MCLSRCHTSRKQWGWGLESGALSFSTPVEGVFILFGHLDVRAVIPARLRHCRETFLCRRISPKQFSNRQEGLYRGGGEPGGGYAQGGLSGPSQQRIL